MARRLFTLLSALSLLMFAAVVALWVRSYRATDAVEFHRGGVRWRVASEAGRLRLDNEPQRRTDQAEIDRERVRQRQDALRLEKELLAALEGLAEDMRLPDPPPRDGPATGAAHGDWDEWSRRIKARDAEMRRVRALIATQSQQPRVPAPLVSKSAPHALPAAATAALPAAWLAAALARAARRWLRRSDNRCLCCGYDLRATPGRCPECGTAPAAEVKA